MKRLLATLLLGCALPWLTGCGLWPTATPACTASAQGIPLIRNFTATEYRAHKQNFDVITDHNGTVYVANFEGLLYYDYSQWRIIYTPGVTRITAVFCDSKGTIWTGGYNYIGRVKHDSNGNLHLHGIDPNHMVTGEVQWIWEKEGHIYFRVNDDKIYTVVNDNIQWAAGEHIPTTGFATLSTGMHVNQVQELDNGLKAVATNGNGIIITDNKDQELFRITEDNGLCSNNVSHITYNRHGLIWGATDNGIFAIGYPSIYTHFTSHEGLRGEVLALQQLDGQLYAGTLSGLFRLRGKQFVQVGDISHACWQLALQGSSLLAATSNGVYRIGSDGSVKQLSTANTLSLMVDAHGYYSGEMDGVYYNTDAAKKVSDVEKVVKICRDKKGDLWTQNLYGKVWHEHTSYSDKHDEEAIITLVEYEGNILPVTSHTTKPFPYPMFSYNDPEGVLWLSDNKGKRIYAFQHGEREKKLSEVVYPLMDYSARAMLRTGSQLWIGGDKGINVVDYTLSEPSKAMKKPQLLLRSVLLNNDSVLWGGHGNMPEQLPTLSSDDRHLTFYFSIDYPSLMLKTQYRTRINGGKWSSWENETTEEYSNLPHGRFTFEVQARDAYGQLSDVVTVKFDIESPLYLRWYMLLLYILLAGLAAYYFTRWRTNRLEKEKNRLEDIVQERTAEVVKLEKVATVAKLTQGLIDRILNPLNYINNFAKLSEGLVNDVKENVEDEKENMDPDNYEDTLDVLDMLKGNLQKVGEHGASTSRTLKAMEEMLKDRSGGIVEMNLTALLHQNEEMVKKYFEKEIAQCHIKTVFNIPDTAISINGNAEQLSKTFMSMLNNAVYAVIKRQKRQPEGYEPQVSLTAQKQGKKVEIRFHDNGIGIEHTIIDKIFDPFFTTKTTGEASGVGLYLSREIVMNLGGDITVQSEKNVYTEFTITLPTL